MASIDTPFRLRVVSDTEGRDPVCGNDLASLVARADRASVAGDRREAERLLAQAYVAYDGEARRGTLLRIADAAERLGLPNVAGELSFLADDDRSQGLRLAAHAVRRWEKLLSTGEHDVDNKVPIQMRPVLVRPVIENLAPEKSALVECDPPQHSSVECCLAESPTPRRPGPKSGLKNPRSPGHGRPVVS